MAAQATTPCVNCERLQAQLDELKATVARLQAQLAAAHKDSSTSSKPPSSDIVKPPKPPPPPGQDKRQPGGQPGHPKHERLAFPPEALTAPLHEYYPAEICPDCGLGLRPAGDPPRIVQQMDIASVPLLVEEYRSHAGWCPHCRAVHYATLPVEVERAGLVGPRLTTLIAYLKGFCHASYSTIRKFLRDVVQVTLSRGQLLEVIGKVSAALAGPYQELLEDLPRQAVLNVDETGHKRNKDPMWTWCFRASLYTLFKIDTRRSADVLIEVLGQEFEGVLGCDHFSAYRRFLRQFDVRLQFCLAHLIRDVKFLLTLPDPRDQAYGARLRDALRALFGVIHNQEEMSPAWFRFSLEAARQKVLWAGTQDVPATRHSSNLAQRLGK